MSLYFETGMLEPEVCHKSFSQWDNSCHAVYQDLLEGKCPGHEFLGWMNVEEIASDEIINKIQSTVSSLRQRVDHLVVIGIGGSYLGAKAVIDALATPEEKARVHFVGCHISAYETAHLLKSLQGKNFAINVISKSGTTTEPAIAFRLFKQLLIEKVGADEAERRIVVTTDAHKGALREYINKSDADIANFEIPRNVGGRFSVLTPVGLFPIAFCGLDIKELVAGAAVCESAFRNQTSAKSNPMLQYAFARNLLLRKGFTVEIMSVFEPRLRALTEWWKQLFGESEGKDKTGIFPASLVMTTDLHSLGQYVQDGRRQVFETFLWVDKADDDLSVPETESDLDKLSYLAGRTLHSINQDAFRGTQLAHREGGVPISTLRVDELNANNLGRLLYFFEASCAISGLLLSVNPFDQPAVEGYKNAMFALLGKPGHEENGAELRQRLAKYLR